MTKYSIFIIVGTLILSGCINTQVPQEDPVSAMTNILNKTDVMTDSQQIKEIYYARAWQSPNDRAYDPIELSNHSATPVNNAEVKIIGTDFDDSLASLAAKLWLIDNAEHTLDLTYYIFKYDIVGEAILGALCNAVERGVDVRIMVDSLGSINPSHTPIRALQSCVDNAGYIRDVTGNPTPYKARVQFSIINALTSIKSWSNRRSHDKLFIKDGYFIGKDVTMTGGRNIATHYYGIDDEGNRNPNTFADLEVVLSSKDSLDNKGNNTTIGEVSSTYYSLLFLHKGNRRITPLNKDGALPEEDINGYLAYRNEAQRSLKKIMAIPGISSAYINMADYLETDMSVGKVRLAHQLENFASKNVVEDAEKIATENANSIEGIFNALFEMAKKTTDKNTKGTFRIVSPYIFTPQYKNNDGEITYDGAIALHEFLKEYPNMKIELITNSILTSDNFFTQSVIDMDTAPRILLPTELRKTWVESMEDSELNDEFVNSPEWIKAVNNPRIGIYETGKGDSSIIGGDTEYGKLHAKFFFTKDFGFVGTSNFDYRSRLYNNEMGYYFLDEKISEQLHIEFDKLKEKSLRWGTKEWLSMRKEVFTQDTEKTRTSKSQRGRFKTMKNTGLIWLF